MSRRRSFFQEDGTFIEILLLRNWVIGETRRISPQSEAVQWLLDAQWFNWDPEDRYEVTRDIEATDSILLTPCRLGAWLQFMVKDGNRKKTVYCLIQLYDTRVMKMNCFRIVTPSQYLKELASALSDLD